MISTSELQVFTPLHDGFSLVSCSLFYFLLHGLGSFFVREAYYGWTICYFHFVGGWQHSHFFSFPCV